MQIESSIRSKTRPLLFDNELIVLKEGSKSLSQMSIVCIDDKVVLHEIEDIKCSFQPFIVSMWQKTLFMICQRDVNDFALVETGNLEFGLEFRQSVKMLYKGISYVPPHGDQSCRNVKLIESIDLLERGSLLMLFLGKKS